MEATLFLGDDRREKHKFRAEREFHDFIHDVFDAAALDFAVANRTMRDADTGEEEAKIIVNFGDGRDGRTRVAAGRLLVNRNGRGEAGDHVDVGFIHDAEEHAGIARKTFDVATLTFGVNRVEGEAGLSGAGKAGNHDKFIAWNIHVEIFEVVLAGATDFDKIVVHSNLVLYRKSLFFTSLVVGGLNGFVPEVEFFEEIGTVFRGAATPGAAATEGLLDFLEFFEKARRLVGEALRAVGFPFFDFVASEGGGVILGLVMKEELREAVIEEMRVIIGEVVGAIVADGRTKKAIVVVEEAVIESALGIYGGRIVGALHLRHALDELGVGEERFEVFLNLVEGEVDFLPTGAREFGGFGGRFGRVGRDLGGVGRDGFFEDAERGDDGAMIILELFHDGLEATLPWVALVKWLFEVEGTSGFGVSFAFQEFVEVVAEVKDEDIAVIRGGEGVGDASMAGRGRIAAGGIDEGLGVVEIDKVGDVAFVAVLIEKVEELRLFVVDEFCDSD